MIPFYKSAIYNLKSEIPLSFNLVAIKIKILLLPLSLQIRQLGTNYAWTGKTTEAATEVLGGMN